MSAVRDQTSAWPEADGLAPYLRSVSAGSDEDYRTPFWNKADRQSVVSAWLDVVEAGKSRLPGRLYELEISQSEKIGPSSVRLPLKDRLVDVLAYFNFPSIELVDAGSFVEFLAGERRNRMRALSHQMAVRRMVLNTNSGLPRFAKRRDVVDQELLTASPGGSWRDLPAVIGWRGQSDGTPVPKQRVVWMFPMSVNIVEMSYFGPMQTWLRNEPYLSAWIGPDSVDTQVHKLLTSEGSSTYSTDFSGYDQSVGPNLSRVGFDLLRLCYTSKHAEEIDALERVFNVIPIVISKSTEIKGVHGVPSGSVFTNYVDSVVHRFLQWDCSRTLGLTLLPNCQVQGDDGLLKFTAETDLDKILRCYESFGLTANIEKQFIGDDDCTYLQRYHHVSQVGGMYPTFRALNSLLGQERFHSEEVWGPDMVILRALMVLENCKHHPLFVDLVKFVMSGDKYGLGSRWPGGMDGYLHRTNVIAKAARVPGFIPSYNQERNVKGLSSFKVVRVIREAT